MLLGVSASSIAEAIQAQQDGADYLGVGAMFPTGTKTDADSVSMEELQKIRTAVSLPIVVIGGINKGNTGRFKPMGIDGLAVVSAIIAQSDIKAAAAELKDLFCGKEKKHGFNAAIFDLDGTILDSMDVWEHIDIQFLKKRNLPVPENYVTEICARSFEEAAQYTIDLLGLQETVEGIIEEWNNMAVEEYSNHVGLLPHALDYLLRLKEHTIQRYLQYNTLVKNGLQHFDAWASTFGETVTAIELTPEGTGYRAKTRFAKFYNLPELMAMFKEVADIKTADMLNLPVPEAEYHNVSVEPSEMQKEMVASLAERAEKVRGGGVDSSVDNMLKITNDGRKLALDQRMLNAMLPDFENSKINACVDNVYRIWEENKNKKSAQLVFCDLSTPKNDGTFSVYNDIRKKLIERGVPESEVRFIHEAETDVKKKELFQKVRKGEVRVLMGSTQKMGAGTNVQDRLIALHDVDCPWRPADLEQRSGRIIRQGNSNPKVEIYRYVTKQTFDAYLYQLVEGKQKFASQIMTSKSPVRSAEDIDETALSYAEIKMLATGNPYIKEKMDLDIQVQKLKLLKSNFLSEKYSLEDKIIKYYPQRITSLENRINGLTADVETAKQHPKPTDDRFVGMEVKGVFYSEKAEAGKAIIAACKEMTSPAPVPLGRYRGFETELSFDTTERFYCVTVKGETGKQVSLGDDVFGNITRIDNAVERFADDLEKAKDSLADTKNQFETAQKEVQKPFVQEEELKSKLARLDELNILLNMDKKENEIVGGEPDEGESTEKRKEKSYER